MIGLRLNNVSEMYVNTATYRGRVNAGFVGKPVSILLFSGAARLAGARLPQGLRLADLVVVGITAVGFTVSLFLATAAFPAGVALE